MRRGERLAWLVIGSAVIALAAMAATILVLERRGDWVDRCTHREGEDAYYDCLARVPALG